MEKELKSKEYLVTFQIEDFGGSSGYIRVNEKGEVDSSAVEDLFYKMIRNNSKSMVKDFQEELKSDLIDNLTPEQENKLQDVHAKQYSGLDDDMHDDYLDWCSDQDYETIKNIIK